ncbi:hypothetical protein NQ176_g7615 [Zarea fungicola]|uniref:Uncharacterized protein n=1 Tax=Zarea fungicola TaxID=93591 RepID=A0ACC1MYA7_9HYPO|nr:hypothetical protein NQ176_g7615 [Lecanicillium fungicola]
MASDFDYATSYNAQLDDINVEWEKGHGEEMASKFDYTASYDTQVDDILAEYEKSDAKRLFQIMVKEVKKKCKTMLDGHRGDEEGSKGREAIKGIVTGRPKGYESLKTKLKSDDNRKDFLEWFGKVDKNGKKQERLLEHQDMGDLAGVRIGLYLPGDVERVLQRMGKEFRNNHVFGTVRDHTRKPGAKNTEPTRHDRGAWEQGSGLSDATWEHYGYKSWQVIVEWDVNVSGQNKHLESTKRFFEPLRVEIQVGTLVTQAWAEVQHDIIYKQPKMIQVTDTMRRIVDATNGMAITTDILFRELERSQKAAEAEAEEKSRWEKMKPFLTFRNYCHDGDVDGVKKLLKQDKHLCTAHDETGLTGLHAACLSGHSEVVAALLQTIENLGKAAKQKILSMTMAGGATALHLAAFYDHASVVEALLPPCLRTGVLNQRNLRARRHFNYLVLRILLTQEESLFLSLTKRL